MSERRIAWVDLETTGLCPDVDRILAIGCIITDTQLRELAREEWLVQSPPDVAFSDPKALEMHRASGLLERCIVSPTDLLDVCDEFAKMLNRFCEEAPTLAGNSVHFDRAFLWSQTELVELFHHRHLDVSALRVMAECANVPGATQVLEGQPAHTPLADLDRSIQLLRRYQALLFKPECRMGV